LATSRPPSRDDPGLDAQPAGERGRLGPAAVDHDNPDAQRVKEGDLGSQAVEGVFVLHHLAAQLHDEDVIPVSPHVAQGALEPRDAAVGIDPVHRPPSR
jgi:hypothetical protein